jgi:hypothetical protein
MCEESVDFRSYHGVPEMKHPALTGGGSLQLKLGVTRLLLASVPETVPNRGIVDPHRGSEQSSCPDTAPPTTTRCATCAGISVSAADWSRFSGQTK